MYDEFRSTLAGEGMERGVVGDPTDPETEVGPIVNESQLHGCSKRDRPRPGRRRDPCWRAGNDSTREAYLARAGSSSRVSETTHSLS